MQNQDLNVLAVSSAKTRGRKYEQSEIQLQVGGVVDDVHFGSKHRQVSLLGANRIEELKSLTGAPDFEYGAFAENIFCSYLDDLQVQPLDIFRIGDAVLEVTSIGKPMHKTVTLVGHYVTPHFGVFCRVLKAGVVRAGDNIEWVPKIFRAKIITLSDRASAGEYKDESGPLIVEQLENFFENKKLRFSADSRIIPDDADQLKQIILDSGADIIVTSGGTGISNRDITPDVVRPMLDMEIPGIMEFIRVKTSENNPNAMLSRSLAGVRAQSLVYCLPGSPKAVGEYMHYLLKSLKHALWMLNDLDGH
jgi:molybdenum cofactor synthesis domain-containing protein